jgi:hypothetical protein
MHHSFHWDYIICVLVAILLQKNCSNHSSIAGVWLFNFSYFIRNGIQSFANAGLSFDKRRKYGGKKEGKVRNL